MKLKIALLGTRGIPNHYGGFEQFAQHLSKGLVEKGFDVYVYASHNHPYKKKYWNEVKIIKKFDPEYIIGLSGQFIYDMNCIIDSRKRNFDAIIQFGYTTNSIWSFLLPKYPGKICNTDGLEWQRSKYPNLIKRFLKYAEKKAVFSNNALISDSPIIADYFLKTYNIHTYYSAYPAEIFLKPDPSVLSTYKLKEGKYNIIIARMQPDNNIETIINGFLASNSQFDLLIIGNIKNRYGRILRKKFRSSRIQFHDGIYEQNILNSLRYYSNIYFHGHSSGGTNPSLLEAMGCSTLIVAHKNPFNEFILKDNCFYFKDFLDIKRIIDLNPQKSNYKTWINNNLNKIQNEYRINTIIEEYRTIIMETINKKNKFI
jgi:hypothetical protein